MKNRKLVVYFMAFLVFAAISCIYESTGSAATQTPAAQSATATLPASTETQTPSTPISPADTATPDEAATPTETAIPIVFDPVNFTSEEVWQGAESCNPQSITVQVRVSPAETVSSVGLFFRVASKTGDDHTPWGEGLAMNPQGGGWYMLYIFGDDFPTIDEFEDTWIDFQFVANNADHQPIAWSAVVREVTLRQCKV